MKMFRTRRRTTKTSIKAGVIEGFRSGLEDLNAEVLHQHGVDVEYEAYKLRFSQPQKMRTYTPDFILPNGIIIETKGHFTTADRQKHLMIKECHPGLEVRFVFSNGNTTISKTSRTSYGDWANHKGFRWATSTIPTTWINEQPRQAWLRAAEIALGWTPPTRR